MNSNGRNSQILLIQEPGIHLELNLFETVNFIENVYATGRAKFIKEKQIKLIKING